MKQRILFFIGIFCFTLSSLPAQNIKDNDISFVYIQLPKEPVGKQFTNYQSTVVLSYAADNAAKKADYDAKMKIADDKYKSDLVQWEKEDHAADVKYSNEIREYNKKSLAEKVADQQLLNEGKPQRFYPPHPSRDSIIPPQLKKEYDTNLLAQSYIHLDGFNNKAENAVSIIVTMFGFDCIQPHIVMESRKMTHYVDGKSQEYMSTFYHYETSYKHPMSVKVEVPGKGLVMDQVIEQFNSYVVVKTAETENSYPPGFDPTAYVQNLQENCLQANLKYINELVNNKYGFARITRKTVLNNVESKKMNYDDYQSAYDNAVAGYNLLSTDKSGANAKIKSAIDTWEKALLESNPSDKKARVDAGVTMATRFNLVEAYIMIGDYANAQIQLDKINAAEPDKKERKRSEELKTLLEDFKMRATANQ
jgi:hypothetical protein